MNRSSIGGIKQSARYVVRTQCILPIVSVISLSTAASSNNSKKKIITLDHVRFLIIKKIMYSI